MPKENKTYKFGVKIIPIKWADKIANKHNLLGFCLESRLRNTFKNIFTPQTHYLVSSLFSHNNLKNANWRKNIFENMYLCLGLLHWMNKALSSSRGIRIAVKVNCQVQKKDFTTTWMAPLKNVLRATKSHRWCQYYEAYSDMNGTCPTHLLNIRKNCPPAHLMQLNFHILSRMTWKWSLYFILCNGLLFFLLSYIPKLI